jgi:hypothetical protein
MMNTLLNVIVAAALILTLAFASELGPSSRTRTAGPPASVPAEATPTAIAVSDD